MRQKKSTLSNELTPYDLKEEGETLKVKWFFIFLSLCIVLISMPLSIDYFIFGNNVPSNISNSDWANFLGGYLGAIIGGAISLIGIAWTITFTREQNQKDRELQIKPLFNARYTNTEHLKISKLSLGVLRVSFFPITDPSDDNSGLIILKNIGMGTALNFRVEVTVENDNRQSYVNFYRNSGESNTDSICSGEEGTISLVINPGYSKVPFSEFERHEDSIDGTPFYERKRDYEIPYSDFFVNISIYYDDVLGNTFEQKMRFKSVFWIEPPQKENDFGYYQTNVSLLENSQGKIIKN